MLVRTDCESKGRDEGIRYHWTGGKGGCGALAGMFALSSVHTIIATLTNQSQRIASNSGVVM